MENISKNSFALALDYFQTNVKIYFQEQYIFANYYEEV